MVKKVKDNEPTPFQDLKLNNFFFILELYYLTMSNGI